MLFAQTSLQPNLCSLCEPCQGTEESHPGEEGHIFRTDTGVVRIIKREFRQGCVWYGMSRSFGMACGMWNGISMLCKQHI